MAELISVDTNVVVRFLTQDDPEQFKKAKEIFANNEVVIATTVILETEWVLRFAYEFDPKSIAHAFRNLFGLRNVQGEHPVRLATAIEWHEKGLDFADALHLAACQETNAFKTFDKDLRKRASSISACPVEAPE